MKNYMITWFAGAGQKTFATSVEARRFARTLGHSCSLWVHVGDGEYELIANL